MATKKESVLSAKEVEETKEETTIKAEDFKTDKYDVLSEIPKELTEKALSTLEAMGVLEDSQDGAIAVAALSDQIKKAKMVAEETQKKMDSLSDKEIEEFETKKKIQNFNLYDYVRKMQDKKRLK